MTTDEYKRPNPDALLAQITEQDERQERGKLKIFLGYVAGVGKTFSMLEAAHLRKNEGVDVAVAYIETHGRKETERLVQGLEIIPRRLVDYRGARLTEMDLDAVLARRPQLTLVDELAHTNAPGSRHPKRYQDVEEILNAGIDVYTTINIQHLESLNDVVRQITGVEVHETVPDSLVDEAYEIELVDLPTDELLQRLKEGKVYVPDQAIRALEKFFRKGNLTALRELAMRRAADRVDHQMVNYMQTRAIPGPWPAGEKILVCVSSHPMGERLVRTGRRLADDLNAEWRVIFVETPGHLGMPEENRLRMQGYLQLAEKLGARTTHVSGPTVAEAVLGFAHEHNITKIIVGKPRRPRWFELLRGSVIDQILQDSGKIDVFVVSEDAPAPEPIRTSRWRPHPPLWRYFASLGMVAMITLVGFPLHAVLDPTNLVMLYLASVVIAAVFLGRGPSMLASFISVLAFDFFFIDPRFTFTVYDTQYILTFIALLLVGIVISNSAALLRDQVDALKQRERQAQAINTFSRELTAAVDLNQVFEIVLRNVRELFGRDVVILLPEGSRLVQRAATPGFALSEDDLAVADWAFKNGKPAGRGTDTLPAAAIRYSPLITSRGIVGILGIRAMETRKNLSLDQRVSLEGFVNLSALAIERASFAEQAAQSEMLRNTEKLQTALLNSISHELRTPLATITGVLTTLGESDRSRTSDGKLDAATKIELIDSATGQARQLNRLVENLLDMTRLEAGAVHLNLEIVDLQDLIGSILNQIHDRLQDHPVQVEIPDGIPLVSIDAVLIGRVLINLLDNASKYSSKGGPIQIRLQKEQNQVWVSIRDEGIGIPPDHIQRIFDKFYRVQHQKQVVGTGLGLSICKGIVEAHGGKIWAANNPDRGVTLTFTLPIQSSRKG